jgi:molybdate transport system ATP-binding protein
VPALSACGPFRSRGGSRGRITAHDPRWILSELTGNFGGLTVPRLDAPVGTALRVRIRARDVILAVIRPTGISALNVLAAEVERLVPIEEGALEVQLRLGGERLLARVTDARARRWA